MPNIQALTNDAEAEDFCRQSRAVIDITAEGCAPCRTLAPILEQLANEHPSIFFATADVESVRGFAQKHNIMGFPTILVFDRGQLIRAYAGAPTRAKLRELVAA